MLYQVGVKDGFAQVKGAGKHIKIVSATNTIRLQALDADGRVLLDSKFRSPMATELPIPAATLNFFTDDQVIELWYSMQPLEYMQLTAVAASRARTSEAKVYPGKSLIVGANPRQSVTLLADDDLPIGGLDVTGNGWPLEAGVKENFLLGGEIYAYKPLPNFNYSAIAGAFALVATGTGYDSVHNWAFSVGEKLIFGRFGSAAYQINKSGGAAAIAQGGEVHAAVKDGDFVYLLVKESLIHTIKRTSNGVTFETVISVQSQLAGIGAQLTNFTNQTNNKKQDLLIDNWLTTPASFSGVRGHVAINIKTGEVKRSPNNIGVSVGIRVLYHPALNNFLLHWPGTGAACGVYVSNNSDWQQIYSNAAVDQRSIMANEQGKVLITEAGALKRLDLESLQVTPLFTTISSDVVVEYLTGSGYLFYGIFEYNIFAVDEAFIPVKVSNTGPWSSTKTLVYDADEGAIYAIRQGNGIIFERLPVAGLPKFSAVNVKVLEYLI